MGLGILRQQEKSASKAIDRKPFWSIGQKKWRRGREFEVALGAIAPARGPAPQGAFTLLSQGFHP